MATVLFNSTSIVHFRYPSLKGTANPILRHLQKTTATPVFGHGTIKFPKPLHITRIGVRASHNFGFKGIEGNFRKCEPHIISGSKIKTDCGKEIRKFLEGPNENLAELADDLWNLLKHIGTHREEEAGLVHLYRKILKPAHIKKMWDIAGYNHTNKAVDMLPSEKQSPVKWGWKSVYINEGILGHKRKRGDEDDDQSSQMSVVDWHGQNQNGEDRKLKRGDEDPQKLRKQFPHGEWKMEIHRGDNGGSYSAVLEAKLDVIPRFKRRVLRSIAKLGVIPRSKRLDLPEKLKFKSSLMLVEKNGSVIPATTERFGLAFEFGDSLWPSSDHFVLYVRAAGPNVLIGRARAGGENSERFWEGFVIVKRE